MAQFFDCRAQDPQGRDCYFAFNLDLIIKVEFTDDGPNLTGAIITTSEKLETPNGRTQYARYTITEPVVARSLLKALCGPAAPNYRG